MGAVYLGQHQLLGRRAAIKVLLPELSARPDIVSRFFNEARAVTSISDPGIVQVFDFGYHSDGAAFIVMEFLEGEPLDRRLARMGRLPAIEALRLCRQIAGSLAAAHAQNIIHRDLKPENIYLVRDGEVASGERSKILDFGIAKLSDNHPGKIKTSTGALMGTPIYMSPEQCRGLSELDHRSDIYSLGCVLFHLLTGRPPFDGEGMGDIIAAHIREPAPVPSSRAPDIPPSVDALVLRCLAKPPAERYQTMHEFAAAIAQLLPYITSPGAPTQWAYPYQSGATPSPYSAPPETPAPPAYGSASMPTPQPAAPVPTPYYGTPRRPPFAGPPDPPMSPAGPAATLRVAPTTLSAGNGQIAAPGSRGAPGPQRARALGWAIAGLLVIGGAGAAIAIVAMRSGGPRGAAVGAGSAIVAPVASGAKIADTAGADAAGAEAATVPDAIPVDAAIPADAAVPDAAIPVDAGAGDAAAPARRPHVPHGAPPRAGSGASPPAGCDRSVDTDCDGIPDVR